MSTVNQQSDLMLSKAFLEATEKFKGQSVKDNPALQAAVKSHGQPLINSLMASGSTKKEAVDFIRVLLATNEIK